MKRVFLMLLGFLLIVGVVAGIFGAILWVAVTVFGMAVGLTITGTLLVGGLVVMWLAVKRWLKRFGGDAEEEDLVSMVLLERKPAEPTREEVERKVKDALGFEGVELVGPTDFPEEMGFGQGFLVSKDGVALSMSFPRVQYTDPDSIPAGGISEEDGAILREHKAWMAFDYHPHPETPPVEEEVVIRWLARLAAEFANEETLGLYTPTYERFAPWEEAHREILRGGEPLAVFGPGPYVKPGRRIVNIAPDDPRMQAAIREARERFPEFAVEFQKATKEERENFLVKAAFGTEPATEHMWVQVESIRDDTVVGQLMNEPNQVPGLNIHDKVTIKLENLSDWAYRTRDGRMGGQFTHEILVGG